MKKQIISLLILLSAQLLWAQSISEFIVIDQIGYRPQSEKIAVIRNPQTGADQAKSFSPSTIYMVVNAETNERLFRKEITVWNNGQEDASSGDKAWHYDFSELQNEGKYYILDTVNNVRSYEFEVRQDIYQELLKTAVRTFFYQRSSFAKEPQYAGNWSDDASHVGVLQDKNCRKYDAPNDPTTELDLHGGWYDAGDLNKYTTWTSNYVIELIKAYEQAPGAWCDDYNLPESGNGIPDVIDEMNWGLEHLQRLQLGNGSVISVVSSANGSPPSTATAQSLYGDVNTTSTLAAGGAYAKASLLYQSLGNPAKAEELRLQAEKAWSWADANPQVIWKNNDEAYNSKGIASGQQEVANEYGRLPYKLQLALYLYELTQDEAYKTYFESNYTQLHLLEWNYAYPFEDREQDIALHYTTLPTADEQVKQKILTAYRNSMKNSPINFPAYQAVQDPYLGYAKDYTWGINRAKCAKGLMLTNLVLYGIDESMNEDAERYAEHYLHNLHGVNPLSKMYLSNVNSLGADNSVTQFYHNWFYEGSADFDEVEVSTYGPAPGFLVGGPTTQYALDACCPDGCGSPANNAKCTAVDMSDVLNQPDQKSYKDVNHSWPINSWVITENSCGYQVAYIRLLSWYAQRKYDCTGTLNGSQQDCSNILTNVNKQTITTDFKVYPNPAKGILNVQGANGIWKIYNILGEFVKQGEEKSIDISNLTKGTYLIYDEEMKPIRFVVE
ncbi:MAG: T9SS type A sorting domain-containing protein [Cytophagales bacterium]|nr:T9SS type A sorting domain-containing protein [Cytophagales bacterium]